jgi:preprotein translocase subunit SecF
MSKLSRIYRGETNIDFIGKRKIWFLLSAVVVGICALTLFTQGLNYGIEFEGGVSTQAPIPDDGPLGDASALEVVEEVRAALGELGSGDAQIQVAEEDAQRLIIVQTKEADDPEEQEQVVATVAETVGTDLSETDSERIGSKWGEEITDKAVRALVIFVVVIFLFISWRFEWKMALSAIIALIHDLLITAGVYSLVGFEVTPSSVVAILTILGYSLYDTVVVFDKVEEDTTLYAATGKMTYQDSANLAINQVFMRSLNTSLATLLPVAALLFVGTGLLGAGTLEDLALALFVGLLCGAYSSVFIAVPLLSLWKEREPRFRNVRERVLRDAKKAAGATASPEPIAAGEAAAVGAPTKPVAGSRPATRPRAGSKKAKRRKRR